MRYEKRLPKFIVNWLIVTSLSLSLYTDLAKAQNRASNYTFLLASGILCTSNDTASCPAVAKSAKGDSYELSGAGTFDAQNKSVKATGTFTYKAPNGAVLESGVWIASELVCFNSYGMDAGASSHRGMPFKPAGIDPRRTQFAPNPMPLGGLAVFRLVLMPMSGRPKSAVLQVNCALGDVPRERSVEGIRLAFEGDGNEFSEEVGGRVMFLSVPSELSATVKGQQQPAPDSARTPGN